MMDRNSSKKVDMFVIPVLKLIKYCEEHDDYSFLHSVSDSQLFTEVSEGKTLLQYIIDKKKEGKNVQLEKIKFYDEKGSSEVLAKKLMIMAKNDVIGYVPKIDQELLLFTGKEDIKSTLEWLLQMDRELTVSKIIPERFIHDPDIVFKLGIGGVEDAYVNAPIPSEEYSDKYIKNSNASYADGCQSPCESLLKELRDLFYADGTSNIEIVNALITSYRYYTSTNSPLAIEELRQLIEIKKANPHTFIYGDTKEGAFFSRTGGGAFFNKYIMSSINHETTHALHFYLSGFYSPPNFGEVMEEVRNDKSTLEKVKNFSIWFNEQRSKIKEEVDSKNISKYYEEKYSGNEKIRLAKFLNRLKNRQRDKYEDDYLPEVLDIILAKTYSVEEYIENRKKIEEEELVSTIVRSDLDAYCAIGDIIDAVYKGKYRHDVLEDDNGEIIPHTFGHGIGYYANPEKCFNEIIANYGVILKSKSAKEGLGMLRDIVGDKFVDMVNDTYEKRILGSKNVKRLGDEVGYGSR